MPQVYIAKYNKFVDAVLNRINRMLGKQYDPVRVKLLTQVQRNNLKLKKNSKEIVKLANKKEAAGITNKMAEFDLARSDKIKYESDSSETDREEPEFVLISKTGNNEEKSEDRATPARQNNKRKTSANKKTGNNKRKNTTTKKTGNKTKQTASNKNKQKARATLYGLSTLKRDGDVAVNMMSNFTMVKTNFVLGPLTLRVEREVAKSGKRELRSATATTAEMYGRLNLRLVHGGVATLHSLRVLQPKQVRIDTTDNHDKTTEFMWKRSPQIATMVSQKLGAVARSMLKPPPQPRP